MRRQLSVTHFTNQNILKLLDEKEKEKKNAAFALSQELAKEKDEAKRKEIWLKAQTLINQ